MSGTAVVLVVAQAFLIDGDPSLGGRSPILIAVWFAVIIVSLLFVGTGLYVGSSRAVRALIEDEVTIANRREALAVAFWAFVATSLTLYLLSEVHFVAVRAALHIVSTAGVSAALLRFAQLERKALRDA